jgi:hypothetical protein
MADRAKLTAYGLPRKPFAIRPAPHERDWMDATSQRYAYRCLPLNIANAHGWELLCTQGFSAWWNGKPGLDAITITPDVAGEVPAISHFGHGIVTFHVNAVFRTEPGYDLMVQGPINRPKDAIAPLSGVVETDWTPFTFTMNWQFTRANTVIRFEPGEVFCHLYPIKRGDIERFDPEFRAIEDDPDLYAEFKAWSASRAGFLSDLKDPNSATNGDKWQKHYYRGQTVGGSEVASDDHRTKIRLQPFMVARPDGEQSGS